MSTLTTLPVSLLALLAFTSSVTPLRAGSIDAVYVFGDSLSDVGNIYAATAHTTPGAPYVNGQFTNGDVWVQDLASLLGLPTITPSLLGGTDYAYGSGETAASSFNTSAPGADLLGPTGQLAQFQAAHIAADPNALYVLWIGSNDLNDMLANAPQSQFPNDIGIIAGNIDTGIGTLAALGAKNILVLTVPDLGQTPAAIAGGPVAIAGASSVSAGLDSTLVNGAGPVPSLATLAAADSIEISVLDTCALLDNIVSNPAAYGLTNVTQSCLTGEIDYSGGTPCATPGQYLFWDELHPTAAGHQIVANQAFTLVTPEPASLADVIAGLAVLALAGAKRRAAKLIESSR